MDKNKYRHKLDNRELIRRAMLDFPLLLLSTRSSNGVTANLVKKDGTHFDKPIKLYHLAQSDMENLVVFEFHHFDESEWTITPMNKDNQSLEEWASRYIPDVRGSLLYWHVLYNIESRLWRPLALLFQSKYITGRDEVPPDYLPKMVPGGEIARKSLTVLVKLLREQTPRNLVDPESHKNNKVLNEGLHKVCQSVAQQALKSINVMSITSSSDDKPDKGDQEFREFIQQMTEERDRVDREMKLMIVEQDKYVEFQTRLNERFMKLIHLRQEEFDAWSRLVRERQAEAEALDRRPKKRRVTFDDNV